MEDNKHRLAQLLLTNDWSLDDQQWMHDHLNCTDTENEDELRSLAFELYNADIETEGKVTLNKKMSNTILADIHREIGVSKPVKIYRWDWLLAVAASAILISSIGYLFKAGIYGNAKGLQITQLVTQKGEVKLVKLDDGTRVWLNSDSRLEYPEKFSGKTREVKLLGEAYFNVAHLKNKPFLIHSQGLTTCVLGTSFNIKAYREDTSVEVAVLTGKVSVIANNSPVRLLEPNQQAVYNKITKNINKPTSLVAADEIAWREGKLRFKNTPLPEVISEVERKYNVLITVDSSLIASTVYANFNNEPVGKVMKLLAETTNSNLKTEGGNYKLLAAPALNGTQKENN